LWDSNANWAREERQVDDEAAARPTFASLPAERVAVKQEEEQESQTAPKTTRLSAAGLSENSSRNNRRHRVPSEEAAKQALPFDVRV
jgi:hypothetical protein